MKVLVEDINLTDIADSIRNKNGGSKTYLPSEMAEAIDEIPSGSDEVLYSASGRCYVKNVTISATVSIIGSYAYAGCPIESVAIQSGVGQIDTAAFMNCTALTSINIPRTVWKTASNAFSGCSALETVTLGENFNCSGLIFSASSNFTVGAIVAMLEALLDRSGQSAYTLTLGATNLAKLTAEQKQIATDKNWNLA